MGRMSAMAATVVILLGLVALPTRAAVDTTACLAPLVSLRSCFEDIAEHPGVRSPACCSFIVEFLNATPNCLCDIIPGDAGLWLGITIDVARAVAVLVNCSVDVPKLTKCPNLTWLPPRNASTPGTPPSPPSSPASNASAPGIPPNPPSRSSSPTKAPTPAPSEGPSVAPATLSGAPLRSVEKLILVLSLASTAIAAVRF